MPLGLRRSSLGEVPSPPQIPCQAHGEASGVLPWETYQKSTLQGARKAVLREASQRRLLSTTTQVLQERDGTWKENASNALNGQNLMWCLLAKKKYLKAHLNFHKQAMKSDFDVERQYFDS